MAPNGSKWLQMTPNDSKWHTRGPIVGRLRLFSPVISCFFQFHSIFPIYSSLFLKFNTRSSALIALALLNKLLVSDKSLHSTPFQNQGGFFERHARRSISSRRTVLCLLEDLEGTEKRASPRKKSEGKGQRQKVKWLCLKIKETKATEHKTTFFPVFFCVLGPFWPFWVGAKKCQLFEESDLKNLFNHFKN